MAPWVCSGVSTAYALVRAHNLSRAEASSDPLLRFVIQHSDLVVILCGSTVVWYGTVRYQAARHGTQSLPSIVDPALVRQLRQVLSALLLGIGLLERRIEQGAYNHLGMLVKRLHAVVRQGVQVLEQIERSPLAVPQVENPKPVIQTSGSVS